MTRSSVWWSGSLIRKESCVRITPGQLCKEIKKQKIIQRNHGERRIQENIIVIVFFVKVIGIGIFQQKQEPEKKI